MKDLQTSDPRKHSRNIQKKLRELIEHLRKDIKKINEPKAKALFETSAEVLIGVETAFKHYEEGTEDAWK